MPPAVAVLAVGNRSRGDDAIGPLLLERLEAWLAGQEHTADFELIEEFQLQIENALDLDGRRLALFIDAGCDTPAPFFFAPVSPAPPVPGHTSHELSPEAVLAVYRQVRGEEPPPAFVLCVHGANFELGAAPGEASREAIEAAFEMLVALCRCPQPEEWRRMAAECARVAK
jgi:hydrogenase maturation protease